ncbi:hypothetical protein Lalb_Chr11g0069821 [Lupinus albus]|uniref:Uncharacterized protein n=1 Tax=Lupinus albus TaxID=3870 RepID=A0A6A4PRX4_LUPAL|nr:hypothetical protein Lalb_Chr11g0069821 [Lupinus albus]
MHKIKFSLPMILTNLLYYLITLFTVMLAGHFGQLQQLLGFTSANSWFNVTRLRPWLVYWGVDA